MFQTSAHKGFTLIEMLIVIVIIGILAAALIPRLTGIQARARDTARTADMRSIDTALDLYLLDNLSYPQNVGYSMNTSGFITSTGVEWINSLQNQLNSYITTLPQDPQNGKSYIYGYVYNTPGNYYRLFADYEIKASEKGLVGYRDMETYIGSQLRDMSGNGNSATITGSPLLRASKKGMGIVFNSHLQRITMNPQGGNTITVSLRYRRNDIEAANNYRTVLGHIGTNTHHLITHSSSKELGIFHFGWYGFGYIVPNDNIYHQYTITYNDDLSASLYVDGGNTYSKTINANLDLNAYPIGSIGNWAGGSYWAGEIDEVKLYNRILSVSEIKDLYK